MKTLLGVLLVISFACATAMTQTKNDQRPDQPAAPGLRPKIEAPAQSWFQQSALAKDDKTQAAPGGKRRRLEDLLPGSTVLIEGAVYMTLGDTLIPLPGGGGSGCFDPTGVETAAKLEKAKAEWAKRPRKD